MLPGAYFHQDAIKEMAKEMLTNELMGNIRINGKIINKQYINSFANRLVKNLIDKYDRR